MTREFLGLHHVQIAMPRGEEGRARAFYGGILGLPEMEKPPTLAARGGLWFRVGAQELHLGVEEGFRPAGRAHPAFLVTGLPELRARWVARGLTPEEDAPLPGYRRCYLRDPFGNRLEFLEPEPTVHG